MASSDQPGGSKSPPRTGAEKRTPKGAAARAPRGRSSTQWLIVIGVIVVLLVVGIVVQSTRSKADNAKVTTPKHATGPNQSEIEGNKSAPVLLQEYADFQCPSCKAFHDTLGPTVDALVSEGKIRYAYSYFPFIGDESVRAAAAGVCAGDQGKFFPFADLLYTNQAAENSGFLTTEKLIAFGKDAGITGSALDRFAKCVRSKTYEGFVRQQADNASKRGITQTPTLLLTGPNGKTFELSGAQTASPAQLKQVVADVAAGKT
jgi:protein-disulfide isomerase